jgi:hypothetical protein
MMNAQQEGPHDGIDGASFSRTNRVWCGMIDFCLAAKAFETEVVRV